MSEQIYCSECGWPGVVWRNPAKPYTYCPHCGSRDCQIKEEETDEEDDELCVEIDKIFYMCQGYPRCELTGEEAEKAQVNGCIWCNRVTVYTDDTEDIKGPIET